MDLIGKSLGRYHILEPLGEGGMAVVYKAFDTHLESQMAVKVIRTDHLGPAVLDRALKRFEREARSVAKLNHPGIVAVVDYGEYEGSPYLVMPYLPGGTLKQYLRQHGRLHWQEASRMLQPVAQALGYAHKMNIVHRDVKPANILLTTRGQPMLTDFGVAKVLDEDATQDLTGTAATVGTPEYMAPEQVMSKTVDHRADIYALGVVFFEMVIGRRPYEADTPMAVLVKHASAPLPRPKDFITDLPDAVEHVLLKALAKKPEDRYNDMAAFALALDGLMKVGIEVVPPPLRSNLLKPAVPSSKPAAVNLQSQVVQPARLADAIPQPSTRQQNKTVPRRMIIPITLAGVMLVAILLIGLVSGWFSGDSTPASALPTKEPEIAGSLLPNPTAASRTVTMKPGTGTAIPPTSTATQPEPEVIMPMVFIPAGEFLMGAPAGEGDADEQPQHRVNLDAFYIDQTEVTNAMFARFVEQSDYLTDAENSGRSYALVGVEWLEVSGADWQHPFGPSSTIEGLGDHPVIHVSWNDANAYCAWVGKRLPTEAEWEKAARGTDGATYPWGERSPAGNLVNYADANTNFDWSVESVNDGYKFTSPVGSYPDGASPYGLLDVAGNVWEWVADWYSKDYYSQSPESNPTGPANGTLRVMRGGAWDDLIKGIRTTYRAAYIQANTNGDTGFRCASDEKVGE